MKSIKLHYINDPFCGWCYAAAPLITAASQLKGFEVELHAGGMLSGKRSTTITAALRDYVMPHDRRIAELTGQVYSAAYFDGLLNDREAILDSSPPITAILAAKQQGLAPLLMFKRIQHGHYAEGRRVAEKSVLIELALDLGLDAAAFEQHFDDLSGEATASHIASSLELLQALGGGGFPTLALEHDGQWQRIDHSPWLGNPQGFTDWLQGLVPQAETPSQAASCNADSCGL